jgi:beta-glucosidase
MKVAGFLAGLMASAGLIASAARAGDVPYALSANLPATASSPPVDPSAPYTPLVRSLIKQLEPDSTPTLPQLQNAARLFQGVAGGVNGDPSCHGVGGVFAPSGTQPSIAPLCWSDAVGINLLTGPNVGRTSAAPEPLAIGAGFDPELANVWGQVEGLEGRRTMVTGIYGPEADVSPYTNWERGLDTLGEDPFLGGVLTAAQVDGIQGRGLMAQVKHFAGFAGSYRYGLAQFDDQAMHEMYLAPFEKAFTEAQASSTMCSYQLYRVTSSHLPGPRDALNVGKSPYAAGDAPKTWPLDEPHWACEQPYALDYVLREMWAWKGFVGADYPSIHSTAAMTQGSAQESLVPYFFGNNDPLQPGPPVLADGFGDPTGDTCAVGHLPAKCSASGARHVSGIPGPACNPDNGCGLVNAVATGALPLSIFNQALAEILYQEERFGLLGCGDTPRAATCTNPGGVGSDRSGNAPLPDGPSTGASPARDLGTKAGDSAVVERMAEEGAVLLKNDGGALPIRPGSDVLVAGFGGEYLIGAPSNEAATGFPDRIAVNPLEQLKTLSGRPGAFGYAGANGGTGAPVPPSALSTADGSVTGGLQRTLGPGSPATDAALDFTKVSAAGPLAAGDYRWTGYVYVPKDDAYTFRFQSSPGASVSFDLDGQPRSLATPASPYCGQYYGHNICVPVSPTNAGYTEAGLTNQEVAAGTLSAGYHQVTIGFDNSAPGSFRFAYSRKDGDIADAAAAARGKAMAIVFADDNRVDVVDQDAQTPPDRKVATLPDEDVRLIDAVAAANPNTVVVLNTADPVVVAPWGDNPNVKAILEMWNAGSEGGTATARLLLGQANPSGHTVLTWPKQGTDTWWAGHPERLNGADDESQADCLSQSPPSTTCKKTVMSQGIFSGYRFYDQQGLAPQYPFGFGLSYTTFGFSNLAVDGHDVTFTVENTGAVAGDEVAQVYVGPGPAVDGVQQAVRSLRGFARVSLAPGESRQVTVHLDDRSFQYWDEKRQSWQTSAGPRRIWVGDADSLDHLPLTATTDVKPARSCVSRRRFAIHVRVRRGLHVRSATLRVAGKTRSVRVRRLKRGRVSAAVDLRGRTGTVRVRLVLRLATGRTVRTTRTYRLCARKR